MKTNSNYAGWKCSSFFQPEDFTIDRWPEVALCACVLQYCEEGLINLKGKLLSLHNFTSLQVAYDKYLSLEVGFLARVSQ